MKAAKKKFIGMTLVVLLLSAFVAAGTANCTVIKDTTPPNPAVKEFKPVPVSPETVEDKLATSQLVISGKVVSVREVASSSTTSGTTNRNTTRRIMTAVVRVIEVYKGAVTSDTVRVDFTRSSVKERPPLVDFSPGEECVLYLVSGGVAGGFATITPFSGKDPLSRMASDKLKVKSVDPKTSPRLEMELKAGSGSFRAGGSIPVVITISNSGGGGAYLYSDIASALSFSVTGPPEVPAPTALEHRPPDRSQYFPLMPGHFFGAYVDLADFIAFSGPGAYMLTASLTTPSSANSGASVVSSAVTIVIDSGK